MCGNPSVKLIYVRIKKSIFFDREWYLNSYEDVKLSRLDPKYHFKNYGMYENRISHPYVGIQSPLFRYFFIFLKYLNIRPYDFDSYSNQKVVRIFKSVIAIFFRYEYKYLEKLRTKRGKIYITSWVGGGVADALQYYIKKDLKSLDYIIVLRSIKDIKSKDIPLFQVEVFSNVYNYPLYFLCPFPSFFLRHLSQDFKEIVDVDIHHVFGFEKMLEIIIMHFNLRLNFYVHDYYLFSSNWSFFAVNLDYNSGKFNFFDTEVNDKWSKISRKLLLEKVSSIIPTSLFTFRLLLNEVSIPTEKLDFQYIPEERNLELIPAKPFIFNDEKVKILILGNLGIYKGLKVLNELVEELVGKTDKYCFHHFGDVSEGTLSKHIINHGWLEKTRRLELINDLSADIAILPAQSPETYSLVLSELLRLRIPIIASGIGAIPERLIDRNYCVIIKEFHKSSSWVDSILNFNELSQGTTNRDWLRSDSELELLRIKRMRL